MYRDRSSTRHPPAVQGRFDMGTESPGSSPVEPKSTWVGAFERVMGDQAELLNSERRSRPAQTRPVPAVSQTLEPKPLSSATFNRDCKQQLSVTAEELDGRLTLADKSLSYNLLTLDFGDVLVGSSQDRIVHLHNHSDLPCVWNARLEEGDNMPTSPPFEITDAATGQPAAVYAMGDDPPAPFGTLGPREDKPLRIRMQPREACRDYEQMLTFTNLYNNVNSIRVVIRANMLGNARNDALAVLSGDVIEFGDCFGGQWTQRTIVLKNLGDVLLEAAFSAQKGAEVVFQLPDLGPTREDIDTDEYPSETGDSAAADELYSGPGGSDAISMGESSRRSNSPLTNPLSTAAGNAATPAPIDMAETPRNPPQLFPSALPSALNLPQQMDVKSQWAQLQVPGPSSRGGTDDESDMDAASLVSQGGSSRPSSPGMHSSMLESQVRYAHADYSPSSQGMSQGGHAGVHSDANHLDATTASGSRNRAIGPGSDGSIMSGYLASGHESDRGSTTGGSGLRSVPAGGITRHWAAAHLGLRPSSSMTRASRTGREDVERHEDGTSSTSDMTALSQDSRIGPFPASSNYSASHLGGGRYHRGGHSAVGSGLRPVEQPHNTQVEELFLRPGTEYRVIVSYRPPRAEADEDFSAGRLKPTTFSISIDYARARVGAKSRGGRERKTVTCHLRTCTSFITVEPKLIDFGEVNVGSRKRAMVTVTNRSDLTTRIDTRVVSKVISMFADEVLVTPQRPYELELQFFPRRVNDKYRKQITIANLFNRSNDQIVEVRAQNVDSEGISLHSMFYSILTPTGANFLDFGDVNINSTRIRTFSVVNISSSKIALELNSPTPEDLVLYVKVEPKASPDNDTTAGNSKSSQKGSGPTSPKPFLSVSPSVEGAKPTQSRPTDRADLKERFLEALATDTTLPARRENKTWRQAQKRAQQGKQGAGGQNAAGEGTSSKPKPAINLLAALKKGGKGRLTVQYGKSVAFKDRTLLRDFEYLDLATGMPIDARRLPPKSKRMHNLDSIEGGTSLRSRGSIRSKRGVGDVPKSVKETKSLAQRLIEKNDPHHIDDGSSLGSLDADSELKRQPALTGKRKAPDAQADPSDLSKLSIHELVAAVERQPDKLSSFYLNNPQAEERHVRMEINLQKELQKAIANERLQRIDLVQLEPGAEQQVVVVLCPNGSTRPHIAGTARKQDLRINFRLVEYDASVLRNTNFARQAMDDDAIPLPIRELMVRSTLCRSIMELGQAHINMGFMEKGETKARKILIQNRSEWALRYCIKKSGSIVSGDIKLGSGRYGVVPGHGKREVEFVFAPSYIGPLQEKLVIEDVADHDNDQTIQLKAQVRKLPNFSVEPTSLDLGALLAGEASASQSFSITNVTNKARKFVINIDDADLRLPVLSPSGDEISFDVAVATVSEAPKAVLSPAEEEEVEHISQKLKVAHRKGQTDKVQKYEERLKQLGVPIPTMTKVEQGSEQSEPVSAVSALAEPDAHFKTESPPEQSSPAEIPSSRLQKQGSVVTFSLDANESLRIVVHILVVATARMRQAVAAPFASDSATAILPPGPPLAAGPMDSNSPSTSVGLEQGHLQQPFSIPIYLHENKNKDETSTVSVSGLLLWNSDRGPREVNPQPFARRTGVVVFSGSR